MLPVLPTTPQRSLHSGAAPRHPLLRRLWMPAILTCSAVSILTSACNQAGGNSNSKDSQNQKRMYLSTGEFNKGYQDGKRDAAASLLDASGAWMWTWMTEEEYRKGYDQGWNDGRKMKRLQSQQKAQQKDQGQQLQDRRKQGNPSTMRPLAQPAKTVQINVPDRERK